MDATEEYIAKLADEAARDGKPHVTARIGNVVILVTATLKPEGRMSQVQCLTQILLKKPMREFSKS